MKIDTERILDLIYDLLNECDIEIWKDIKYIELADFWTNMIERTYYEHQNADYLELEKVRQRELEKFLFS